MLRFIPYFWLLALGYGEKSLKIDVYPGFGWDHLRFLDMSPIYDVSNFNNSDVFQSCIEIIPLHENKIETSSVVIDMYDSQTTDYSSNLFIGGSAGYAGFKIGGSYSNEYQKVKQEQGEEKTVTLRNHIDYLMVDVILLPSCPLNPQAKKDLIEIAKYATTDRPLMANYLAQLFVKKYGTHFISRLYLGGSISEDDFISHSAYYSNNFDKRSQKAAAEASFLGTFSLSASFSSGWGNSQTNINSYKQNIERKVIHSQGGDVLILGNTMQTWQASVKSRPAIIRRAIENLTYIIQADKLPELTEMALTQVRQKIRQAIDTYIDMNTIRGCIKRDSPSFDWIATVDDGSCGPATLNTYFGGFVQTCTEDGRRPSKCAQYQKKNYYTNTDECKSGFSKYLLHRLDQYESLYRRDCRKCGFLWLSQCCDDTYIGVGQRTILLHGCNQASSSSTSNLMHVFGGSYTSKKENPVTNTKGCPSGFSQAIGPNDITVCLAERISTTMRLLPRYGGIYSCDKGNIATDAVTKSCSTGFSAYVMGNTEDGCLLYVCLKFETPDKKRFPEVALPPFFEIEVYNSTVKVNNTMQNGLITSRMIDGPDMEKPGGSANSAPDHVSLGLSISALWLAVLSISVIGLI